MSTSQNTARTKDGGGAVDLDSYLWPNTGTEPSDTANAAYAAYDEPVAGLDNNANYGITWDIGALNYETGALQSRVDDLESRIDSLRNDLNSLEDSFSTHNHDNRYYKQTAANDRFVNVSGDTMTGTLTQDSTNTSTAAYEATGETSTYSQAVQDGNGRASHYWNVEAGTQNLIADNEGASWWFMGGGNMHLDLYDGQSGDAGTTPSWTQVLNATTSGVTFGAGVTLGDDMDANNEEIRNIRGARFATDLNDPIVFEDSSGGSNDVPHTLRYNTRDLRTWSGDTEQTAMHWTSNADVRIPNGDLTLGNSIATVTLGSGIGPHTLAFGNDDSGGGLSFVMRTSPNLLSVEKPDGSRVWSTDQDNSTVDFGPTNYVVLPVRSGAPSSPPSGATWLET